MSDDLEILSELKLPGYILASGCRWPKCEAHQKKNLKMPIIFLYIYTTLIGSEGDLQPIKITKIFGCRDDPVQVQISQLLEN